MPWKRGAVLCTLALVATLLANMSCGKKEKENEPEQKNTDALVLSAPCTEDEENTMRIIRSDNESIAQLCINRLWGNPRQVASYLKCRGIGFYPIINNDKRGVSCRNANGVISLAVQWYPSGQGVELCNPEERNRWFSARDREGVSIALRCTESGQLDASEAKTKFACNDPDRSFKTTILNEGKFVACINDDGVYSMITRDDGGFLTNSNCFEPGKWELFKDRDGVFRAGRCDATESPAPGRFINLSSPSSTFSCPRGQVPVLGPEKATVTCQ